MTKLSASHLRSLEKSTAKYQESLSEAWRYLDARGITEKTAEHFRLGYVKEPSRGDENYQGRLCVPYLRQVGVVAQRFRALGDSDCKYLGRTGVDTGLFHVEAFFADTDTCVITEGEFDAIVLHQIGIPSVGVAGAHGWKSHYWRLFQDFDQLIVFRDNDDAGKRLAKDIQEDFPATIIVRMPVDDVNEAYLNPEYGEDWLKEMARV
jgi:DNA primase